MMAALDVLGLGSVAWDELLYVQRFPEPDMKMRIERRIQQCGGLTGNALIAAARFGARCAYAGRLGTGAAAKAVERAFANEGIDTTSAIRDASSRVVESTIVVAEQTGTRNVFSFSPGGTGAHDLLPAAEFIQTTQVLFVDHHGLVGAIRAARIAREAGRAVVGDFERDDSPQLREALALVDHLILSEAFARRITGAASAGAAAESLWTDDRAVVAVTAGAGGVWFLTRGANVRHLPAFGVQAVDTCGCGDIFHGVYAAALALGKDVKERLRLASAAAAIKAARQAGGPPTRAEIDNFLKTIVSESPVSSSIS